jgi:hypothetical protein
MRVDQSSINDQLSSTASRAAESQRIQVDTSPSSGSARAAGADHVDLSGLAGRISQAMQSAAAQSSARVSQLQQSYRAGRYQPDVQQLSQALAGS